MQALRTRGTSDIIGGLLMFAIGVAAAYQGSSYQVGTLEIMGPGFFPVTLGVALALVGAAIAINGLRTQTTSGTRARPEWRGWFAIVAGVLSFAIVGKHLGLAPASFSVVLISALGDRQNTFKDAVILALAIVVVCILLFSLALKVEFPIFSWQ